MGPRAAKTPDTEHERQQQVDEMTAEHGLDWTQQYKPGSFGCHELLDRVSLAADIVERHVLSHPACIQNRDWYALAEKAADALQELYQRVGEAHLNDENTAGGGP